MVPNIQTGSLVFVNSNYKYEKLAVGDVIAFEPKEGTLVIHRIINIENNLIETKGDNNEVSDGFSTNEENYRGYVIFDIPKAGYVLAWMQTKRGIILTVTFVLALILINSLVSNENKNEEKLSNAKNG